MNPFIVLLANVISLYTYCVIAQAIVVTLISFNVINGYQPAVRKIVHALNRLVEPALKHIRKVIPELGGLDISPIVLILLLNFAQHALYYYF